MTTPNPDAYLTLNAVCADIGLRPRTVAALIQSGELPGAKYGNVYRIPVAQWRQYQAGTWKPTKPTDTKPVDFLARRSA